LRFDVYDVVLAGMPDWRRKSPPEDGGLSVYRSGFGMREHAPGAKARLLDPPVRPKAEALGYLEARKKSGAVGAAFRVAEAEVLGYLEARAKSGVVGAAFGEPRLKPSGT
jgi:hypothetical protein